MGYRTMQPFNARMLSYWNTILEDPTISTPYYVQLVFEASNITIFKCTYSEGHVAVTI
jgi:hypothetical protein